MRPSSAGFQPFAVDPRSGPSSATRSGGPPDWLLTAAGAALAGATVLLALALATWRAADPSFSTLTIAPPRNLLGIPGALLADGLIQTLGLGAPMVLVPLVFWSALLWGGRRVSLFQLRVMVAAAGVVALSGGLSAVPASASWPLHTGLGGLVGDLVLHLGAGAVGALTTMAAPAVAGLVLSLVGATALLASLGLTGAELVALVRTPLTLHLPDSSWVAHLKRREAEGDDLGATVATTTVSPPVASTAAPPVSPATPVAAPTAPVLAAEPAGLARETLAPAPAQRPHALPLALPVIPLHILPTGAPLASPAPAADAGARRVLAERIATVLRTFAVEADVQPLGRGSCLDTFLVTLAAGIKPSRSAGLADDIARSLEVPSVRFVPIPGRSSLLVEVAHRQALAPALRPVIEALDDPLGDQHVVLGRSTLDRALAVRLGDLGHVLVAGGSAGDRLGFLRALVVAALMQPTAAKTRVVVIGHDLDDVATLPHAAALSQDASHADTTLIVVEDLAALDPTSPAWATLHVAMTMTQGVHVLAATSELPPAELIERFTTRLSFALMAKADSRALLGATGAEDLLPGADALMVATAPSVRDAIGGEPARLHPVALEADAVRRIAAWARSPRAETATEAQRVQPTTAAGLSRSPFMNVPRTTEAEDLYERAIAALIAARSAEPNVLCRRLGLAYPQALDLLARMATEGIVIDVDGERVINIPRAA